MPKLIEAMKQIKDLQRKAADIREKIQKHHADIDIEVPVYGTPEQQRDMVSQWLQAHSDIVKEIGKLRFAIQKTNIQTPVTIILGEKSVTKTITEWISRRKDLAALDAQAWDCLNDKGIKPAINIQKTDGTLQEVKIRRYYDPKVKDDKRELYRSEPSLIDGSLEVVNAVTDLVL
jgi:hypothetical protein